jgi:hypothetical protein
MAQGTVKWFKNEKGVERTTDSEAHRGLAPMYPKGDVYSVESALRRTLCGPPVVRRIGALPLCTPKAVSVRCESKLRRR